MPKHATPTPIEDRLLRSYGRRKGHRLSAHKDRLMQERLPALRLDLTRAAPAPLTGLFQPQTADVWLEIGFGAGEHLIGQAEAHATVGLIGCEPFINGVASLLSKADAKGLHNIRLYDGDAREVLAWLPDGAVGRVFLLFPDPWPKTRHQKRRFLNAETAAEIARILRPGGEFRFASDWPDYVAQALRVLAQNGGFEWLAEGPKDWRRRPADWPQTRYEAKAVTDGRACAYLCFRRL